MCPGPPDASAFCHLDPALGIAHWHNLRVFLIAGSLGWQHLTALERGALDLLQRYPGGILSLTLVSPDSPMTGRTMRERFSQMRNELGPRLLRSAVVVEGDGVWARTVRTLLRGLDLLVPPKYRFQLHGDLEPALAALLPLVQPRDGRAPRPAELLSLIAALRERVRACDAPVSASAGSGSA